MPSKQNFQVLMKIVIKTLGCKANRYESDKVQDIFGKENYVSDLQTYKLNDADVILINTCTVTQNADKKSRQSISPLKKRFPKAKVVIFGCGANIAKEEYTKLPNVDYVIQKREDLYELLENFSNDFPESCETTNFSENRTRSLIKIQDGCNNFCTYCIIPYARGREKSVPLEEILKEVREKIANGYKEIILTGINIGMWKHKNMDLPDLIETILAETDLPRLRLGSIEPQMYPDKFYNLFKNKRFCPHLHVSLQSGSDTILKSMNRHYDKTLFTSMIRNLRKASPNIGITTDVIVGFPGESQKLFEETLKYIQEIQFSKIHIFPYSRRKGTIAASMVNQIPPDIKKERCAKMAKIERIMRENFYKNNIGTVQNVLIETIDENGIGKGFTPNYIRVSVNLKESETKPNDIVQILLEKLNKDKIEVSGKLKVLKIF